MKIIQMSDFHFLESTDIDNCNHKIEKLYESVHEKLKGDEDIVFCICGDIVEQGERLGYSKAEAVFSNLKNIFSKFRCSFHFIPGNHDLVDGNLIYFDKFIEQYLSNKYCFEEQNIVVIKDFPGINLIMVNSSFHRVKDHGSIDFTVLNDALNQCDGNSIIVTHHSIISEDDKDISLIRNSYRLIKIIKKHRVIALIHGHTHGYSDITISEACKVIGVGPMFKPEVNINNQFNLISIVANDIDEVINYGYRSDLDSYQAIPVYLKIINNSYIGSKVSEVYPIVVENTKAYGCLNNLNVTINISFENFIFEIERNFKDQIETAVQWQENEPPETLYFNHGMYMDKGSKNGLEYIIDELNSKPTSSRALIPLIDIEDIIGSGDNFLPSLNILQFSFKDNKKSDLYVTLYLRALEVNYFLKINICEIYVAVKRIQQKINSISNLVINIFAFRAQYKEHFGCFKKAKIDLIAPERMMLYCQNKKITNLIDLLTNKLQLSETVVETKGIENLCSCIQNYQDYYKDDYYNPELIDNIIKLKDEVINLESLRSSTSIYSEIAKKESHVGEQMKNVIIKLGSLKEV